MKYPLLVKLRHFYIDLSNVLHGLALLRYPETIQFVGENRLHMLLVDGIRRNNPTVKLDNNLVVMAYRADRLFLGREVTLVGSTILTFGDARNGYGNIAIGDASWIGQYNNLRACGGGNISIGRNCLISQFCSLIGSNHSIERGRPIIEQGADSSRLGVVLEDDVWLGAGVTVMPGVTVHKGAVIGANAVVTKDVPAYEIWAGVPAVKISERL